MNLESDTMLALGKQGRDLAAHSKRTLADMLIQGVAHPDGTVTYLAGPLSAVMAWRREEMIETLIEWHERD